MKTMMAKQCSRSSKHCTLKNRGGSKWLDLFVERTKEREIKMNEMMEDVNETIQTINQTISNRTSLIKSAVISSKEETPEIGHAQVEDDKEYGDEYCEDEDHEYTNPEQMLMMNSESLLPTTAPLDDELLGNVRSIGQHLDEIQSQVDIRISESQLLDQKCKEELETNVARQYVDIDTNRRKERGNFQRQLEDDQKMLQQLQKEIKIGEEKKDEAAITIQKYLRGYFVRKQYSEQMELTRREVKMKLFNERVRAIDHKRKKEQLQREQIQQNEKEEQMIREEQERLEKEKLEKLQEEQRIKEEQERLRKEEEEQRRKAEQERLKKEKRQRIKEEEERLRLEQEQRIKEEQERLRKEEEEQRRKAEQERLKKEKRQRIKEEEERLRMEQEQKLKEEQERLRMEQEQKLKEEQERLKKEEHERLQRMRRQEHEERVKLEEEMRLKDEEERLRKEEETKQESTKSPSQAFQENLMKWRQSLGSVNHPRLEASRASRRTSSSYQRSRKLSMASRLTPIGEKELIQATWPHYREERRTMETLQRVYMQQLVTMTSQGCALAGDRRCVSLTHVTINHCGLEAVEDFEHLLNLKHFDVSHNRIKFAELSGMANVESIALSHNRLTSLHGIWVCKSLVYLDLSHNDLSKIPADLCQLENLLHLRLNNNTLLHVRNSLPINLVTLDLSHNHVASLDGVQRCVTLNKLRATDNNLTAVQPHIFRHLTLLTRLDLSANAIESVMAADTWLPSMTQLDLSTNQIQADVVTSSLHGSLPNLRRLDVSGNLIVDIRPLVDALRPCAHLRELLAARNLPQVAGDVEPPPAFTVTTGDGEDCGMTGSGGWREEMMEEELMIGRIGIAGEEEEFVRMLYARMRVEEVEIEEMKELRGWDRDQRSLPPDTLPLHCQYLKEMFRMNQQLRKERRRRGRYGTSGPLTSAHSDDDDADDVIAADDDDQRRKQPDSSSTPHHHHHHHKLPEVVEWGGDELPEVDLASLEFDEDLFDRQWAVKIDAAENIEQQSVGTNDGAETSATTRRLKSQWSSDTDVTGGGKAMRASSSKLPLPPIPPSSCTTGHNRAVKSASGTRHRAMSSADDGVDGGGRETTRSRFSAYEERMMQEWNISSELLLRRAEHMGRRRKKKGNAESKWKRFQQMNKDKPKVPVRDYKTEAQGRRIDYFKAQESRTAKAEFRKSEDEERRKRFTYEWLQQSGDHFQQAASTAAVMTSRDDDVSTTRCPDDGGRRKPFLPPILATKKIPRDEDDVESLSINSFRSGGLPAPPKDYLLRDIIRRHHRK